MSRTVPCRAGWEDHRCDRDRYRIEANVIESLLAFISMVAGMYVNTVIDTVDIHTQRVLFVSKFLRLAANLYHGTGPYKVGAVLHCLSFVLRLYQ